MKASEIVENSDILVQAMGGGWPSFHDANVVAAASASGRQSVTIHVFIMTDRADENGYYITERHHLVELVMTEVATSTLPPGYSSDCLDTLVVEPSGPLVRVAFESHTDQDGEVLCGRIRVTSAVSCMVAGTVVAA